MTVTNLWCFFEAVFKNTTPYPSHLQFYFQASNVFCLLAEIAILKESSFEFSDTVLHVI